MYIGANVNTEVTYVDALPLGIGELSFTHVYKSCIWFPHNNLKSP